MAEAVGDSAYFRGLEWSSPRFMHRGLDRSTVGKRQKISRFPQPCIIGSLMPCAHKCHVRLRQSSEQGLEGYTHTTPGQKAIQCRPKSLMSRFSIDVKPLTTEDLEGKLIEKAWAESFES